MDGSRKGKGAGEVGVRAWGSSKGPCLIWGLMGG